MGHDWPKLKRGRDAYVLRLNGIYERNLDKKGIVTVRAAARLQSATEHRRRQRRGLPGASTS